MKTDYTLYLVSDSTGLSDTIFLKKLEASFQGGVTIVQLREKNRETNAFYTLALKVKALCDQYQIPLIIDDRLDIALAVNATGVHVGAQDLPVKVVREILGPNKLIGATTKTVSAAIQAQKDGADYLGVGAIYPTTTKVKTVLTSIETLKEICRNVTIPVCAIGGLNYENCDVLKGTPIAGICVVSAIMKAPNCYNASKILKEKVESLIK